MFGFIWHNTCLAYYSSMLIFTYCLIELLSMKKNTSLLLISRDSFVIGLLNGYSIANKISIEISDGKRLHLDDVSKNLQLIIIDLRNCNTLSTLPSLSYLSNLKRSLNIPVCAIRDNSDEEIILSNSWIDCFFEEPIPEQLYEYFQKFFNKNNSHSERRHGERRDSIDRRSISEHIPLDNFRNSPFSKNTRNVYELGSFVIDNGCNTVFLSDKNLQLTRKEFKLFCLLASDINRAFNADEIIKHLWPTEYRANKSDLYQYMHLLRKKIEKDSDNPHWILTVKGVGYRLHIPANEIKNKVASTRDFLPNRRTLKFSA